MEGGVVHEKFCNFAPQKMLQKTKYWNTSFIKRLVKLYLVKIHLESYQGHR